MKSVALVKLKREAAELNQSNVITSKGMFITSIFHCR